MLIGFTGSSERITKKQKEVLKILFKFIQLIFERRSYLHHGDCIKADACAHKLARQAGFGICLHPPTNPSKRAFCKADVTYHPEPYLKRDQNIVNKTEILIACPKTKREVLRSGTWATIRYAKKAKKPIIIIYP